MTDCLLFLLLFVLEVSLPGLWGPLQGDGNRVIVRAGGDNEGMGKARARVRVRVRVRR